VYGRTKVCPDAIRRAIQQLAYSMAKPEPQESSENQYLGHRMLFTIENQQSYKKSFNYQNYMKKNNHDTNALHTRSRGITHMSGIIELRNRKMQNTPHIEILPLSVSEVLNNIFKQMILM